MKTTRTLLAFTVLSLCCWLTAAETVIINPKNSTAALSEEEMKDLFLGRKSTWADGSKVIVVVLKEGPSHTALLHQLGKNTSQFSTNWKRVIFTGKGTMPELADSEAELVEFVAKNPGAIGFVDVGKVKDGAKAVTVK